MATCVAAEPASGYLVLSRLSAPVMLTFEPVGRWFESHDSHMRVRSEGDGVRGEEVESEEEEDGREEVNPLFLDPTQWKDQDHYALLGLVRMRYKASPQEIRKAYRQKVLQHHPDKQQEPDLEGGDDHFKCIKIAYDILSNPKRRRAYDSIDPTFDDSVPPISAQSRENFFDEFSPVFQENARWSVRQPVPELGDANSTLEDVDAFYSFWYDFESWREFSWLDEENTEKGECREERRWMEKQNKAVRLRRKKEEMIRIRTLVDNAYTCDPRVKQFKEAEKAEKEARKRAREESAKLEAMEREKEQQRKSEEEMVLRLKQEEEARVQAAQMKKEKEAVKKAMRKERRKFRDTCKAHNYFASSEDELVGRMQDLERVCEALSLERLQELNERTEGLPASEACSIFKEEVAALKRQEREKMAAAAQAKASQSTSTSHKAGTVGGEWRREEVQLLVKAVTLYPAGTVKRWETIAGFINTHSPDDCQEKSARQAISKMKALQKLDSSDKDRENKMAFAKFEKEHLARGHVETTPTERYDGPKPWTAEEQKLLEKAMRTHPASSPERWEKISAMVQSRSKAECIARCKELVARVKAKKSGSTGEKKSGSTGEKR